jgi:hypothetical protein
MGEVGEVTVTLAPPVVAALLEHYMMNDYLGKAEAFGNWAVSTQYKYATRANVLANRAPLDRAEERLLRLGWGQDPEERGSITYTEDPGRLRDDLLELVKDELSAEISIAARQFAEDGDAGDLYSRGEQVTGVADLLARLEQLGREESR